MLRRMTMTRSRFFDLHPYYCIPSLLLAKQLQRKLLFTYTWIVMGEARKTTVTTTTTIKKKQKKKKGKTKRRHTSLWMENYADSCSTFFFYLVLFLSPLFPAFFFLVYLFVCFAVVVAVHSSTHSTEREKESNYSRADERMCRFYELMRIARHRNAAFEEPLKVLFFFFFL